jgi:hypothetical protein
MFDVRRGLSLPGLLLPGLRRRDSGWAGPGVYGMLAIGALMLLGIAVAAPSGIPNQVRVAQLASVQLADDDGDQALFAASALAPGHSVTRCLEVGYTGPADQGMVRLAATDVTGPLAAALTVSVEIGTGGGFASCAGFSGASFYTGPLTGLAGEEAERHGGRHRPTGTGCPPGSHPPIVGARECLPARPGVQFGCIPGRCRSAGGVQHDGFAGQRAAASSIRAQRIRPRWLYAWGWLPRPRSASGSYCSGSSPVGPAQSSIWSNSSSASVRRPVRR